MNNFNRDIRPALQAATDSKAFRYSPGIIPGLVLFSDLLMIGVAVVLICALTDVDLASVHMGVIGSNTLFYFLVGRFSSVYSLHTTMHPLQAADSVVITMTSAFFFTMANYMWFTPDQPIGLRWLMHAPVSLLLIVFARVLIGGALARLARAGYVGSKMAILGAGEQARRFLRRYEDARPYFANLVGVYSRGPRGAEADALPVSGDFDALLCDARAGRIDVVIVAMPWRDDRAVIETVQQIKELPVDVFLSADLVGFELAFRPVVGEMRGMPVFEVVQRPISGWGSALKTIEDYVLAGIGLVLVSPLLLALAIAIKLDSPGPVFFQQRRLGFNNREFYIYKFRSMYHRETPEAVVKQATQGDPRVTRVGRIIRATSLDELPQLLNVLDGTMSLVGPRPHALNHNEEYGRAIRGYFARHRVKPGITGWAQVNGLRGETTGALDKMEARIEHDIYYAENWSLLFDLRILIMTVFVAPFQKTAY